MNHLKMFGGFSRAVALLMSLLLMLGLGGCDQTSSSSGDSGELLISLTDAEGDFVSYTVDVVSLQMQKQNGATVETLPLTTTLDFAQYVEATEFLTAATIPSGKYTGAKITLDFSNAQIMVQDANGDAIAATAVDTHGDPLHQVTVDVSLNGGSDFVIAPGVPANITLDFDLNSSNVVTINGNTATVVVQPVLLADTVIEDPKPHRVRGVLGAVSTVENSFKVHLRPFRHVLNRFGTLNVHVDNTTTYEIDGVMYGPADGLNALAQLPVATAVVAQGGLDMTSHQFVAQEVYAGSSVPWGNKDIVSGNVIARSGDVLTIRGASIQRANGSFSFNDNLTVNLSNSTKVLKQADFTHVYTKDDVSVGQAVTILGQFTNNTVNADLVRMHFTQLAATVVNVSPLVIDLQGIDRRRVALFDFTGTGSDAMSDADPANYEIDTGSLSLSNLALGDPLKVRGFARPFGMAPEDFTAQTIVDVVNLPAHIAVGFAEGSVNAISSIDGTGLLLNLNAAGDLHDMYRAGIATDLTSLVAMPLIAPRSSNQGLFVICRGESIAVYISWSEFSTALNTALDGNTAVIGVHAHGEYAASTNVLTARSVQVRLAE
jgi:hypothetical protein